MFTADHICITSGSEAQAGSFLGAELCMDSNDFFTMEELPESVAVLGGGYIAVELAQILQSLGVKTSLIVRSRMMRFLDEDLLNVLLDEMDHSGLQVLQGSSHEKVEKLANGKLRVTMTDGSYKDVD